MSNVLDELRSELEHQNSRRQALQDERADLESRLRQNQAELDANANLILELGSDIEQREKTNGD